MPRCVRLSGDGPGDVKESFYLSDPGKTEQVLPSELECGRGTMAAFFAGCDDLARVLLEALAVGLGVSITSMGMRESKVTIESLNAPSCRKISSPKPTRGKVAACV